MFVMKRCFNPVCLGGTSPPSRVRRAHVVLLMLEKRLAGFHGLDELLASPRVSGLVASVDGMRIVVPIAEVNDEGTEYLTSIWELDYGLQPRELVARLMETGAVGCNLEGSQHGIVKDPRQQADWLNEAGDALFINARVDTFLFGNGDPMDAVGRARLGVAASLGYQDGATPMLGVASAG